MVAGLPCASQRLDGCVVAVEERSSSGTMPVTGSRETQSAGRRPVADEPEESPPGLDAFDRMMPSDARTSASRHLDGAVIAGHRDIREMVRKAGLEPARLAALVPKTRASTNSATFAKDPRAGIPGIMPRPCGACHSPTPAPGRRRFPQTKNARQCRASSYNWWAVKDSNLGPID